MTCAVRFLAAAAAAAAALLYGPAASYAEPRVLGRQYTRCTTCHYSPTGGGLLTPYGRSLSHRELSMFVEPVASHDGADEEAPGEEAFLWGLTGEALGPVQLGVDIRPSHVSFSFAGVRTSRNFFMTADLLAAVELGNWTLYGQAGRQPTATGGELDSYEYWVGYRPSETVALRAGRFLPAYGVRFADHTSFNRRHLGLAQHDQVYGVEISRATDRTLLQVGAGPGQADAILDDERTSRFTTTGRWQFDAGPRTVLVASGLYRHASDDVPRMGAAGGALGFSPAPRTTIWTQVDAERHEGPGGVRWVFVNETSYEAVRGLWLTASPQVRAGGGPDAPDLVRLALGAVVLPRTHWNVNLTYYRDRNRTLAITTHTVLAQLHLY